MVSPPALELPNGSTCGPPRPLTIGPCSVTTAIVGFDLRPGIDGICGPARRRRFRVARQIQPRRRVGIVGPPPVSGEIRGAPTSSLMRA
jgi:hypothetical protein